MCVMCECDALRQQRKGGPAISRHGGNKSPRESDERRVSLHLSQCIEHLTQRSFPPVRDAERCEHAVGAGWRTQGTGHRAR